MARKTQAPSRTRTRTPARSRKKNPRSLAIAAKGIKTSHDFANMMSALMSDLIEESITPGIGNAVCNAGGKLLKVVELQAKFGTSGTSSGDKVLLLSEREAG